MANWKLIPRRNSDLFTHLASLRGLTQDSLEPDFLRDLHDPYLLPDMEQACALIRQAVQERWKVTVFGDYDADGTPASVVLAQVLTKIGLDTKVQLPTRQSGYGLRVNSVEEIAQTSQLLITVDTGITAVAEIERAKELGLKVIVLDHHLPGSTLPPADALVDPFLTTSKYPFAHLCGCALAYKFAVALAKDFPHLTESFLKWLLDLVAISTVADMMPLIGENRSLVHYGLKVLRHNRRAGLKSLLELAQIIPDDLTSHSLGYVIGPRLNASGRLDDNRPAFELLMADDLIQAQKWAAQVEGANRQRQDLVAKIFQEAEELLFQQNNRDDHFYLVLGDQWPAGVVGLVAGRLAGKHHRPVIVGTRHGEEIRASARSNQKYSMIDGLHHRADLLDHFGGHRQAAGLSMQQANWAAIQKALKSHARELLAVSDLQPTYLAEASLEPSDLSLECVTTIDRLGPFGLGNPQPLVILQECHVVSQRTMGAAGQHLKLNLKHQSQPIEAVAFNFSTRYNQQPLKTLDLLGHLERNSWNGTTRLQFKVVDYRSAEATVEAATDEDVKTYFYLP